MQLQVTNLQLANSKNQKIEFNRPTLSKEELKTVLECLVDDLLYTGSIVNRFEKEFRSTFQLKNTISTNSLTAAYHLSFMALGIGKGDKILLSSLAPHQALDAIFLVGAEPIVVDIGKNSFHMSAEGLQAAIQTHIPIAILVDHSFGCLYKMPENLPENTYLIEDYSEALGADSENIAVGKQGHISICGLSENHVITVGNGAMLNTSDNTLAQNIRELKFQSQVPRKEAVPKYEYNLIDYQAAIGIEQLSKLGLIIERKKRIAQIYLQAVLSSDHQTFFQKADHDQFNRFPVIIAKSFNEVERYFKSIQIATQRTTSSPIHRILGLANSDFPNTERVYQRGHCIPIYPNLSKDNINRIASSLRGIY
ncbi:MAG: DegT/DnrJ/EryC1/StrS aminotransferase family protein [Spirochaetota bacterium]